MKKLGKEGHRRRVRQMYLKNGLNGMPEHNVLELLLFYAIPRKDVKQLSYDLINHFGSLKRVLAASTDELQAVEGVGENTAGFLTLFRNLNHYLQEAGNDNVKRLSNLDAAIDYVENILCGLENETVIMITLDNNLRVIKWREVGKGIVNATTVVRRVITDSIAFDHASSVILAHNHPHGSCRPSNDDVAFTQSTRKILNAINVSLSDHIIVGEEESFAFSREIDYYQYINAK